jgi:hypothetical protein
MDYIKAFDLLDRDMIIRKKLKWSVTAVMLKSA